MKVESHRPEVVVLLPTGRDSRTVCDLLEREEIPCSACEDFEDLIAQVRAACGPVVVGEEALRGVKVERLIRMLDAQPEWSDLPILLLRGKGSKKGVTGRLAERSSTSVVYRPLEIPTFISMIRLAMENRLRQFSMRDLFHTKMALQESEQRFRTMADGSPLIIWVTDLKGNIEFVNAEYCRFFGTTLHAVKREGWQPLVHPDDADDYVATFVDALREQKPFKAESRVRRHDGQWRWIMSYGTPRFSSPDGDCMGMVGSSPDITDRKEAEATTKRLNQRLEQKVAKRTEEAEKRSRQLQSLALELIEAEDRERERIARLLHDDLQQHLATVKLKLDMMHPMDRGRRESDEPLRRCVDLLSEAIQKTRKLSHDLSPPGLRRSGLLPCLEGLVAEFRSNQGLDLELTCSEDAEPESRPVAAFLYQALKELLFNVVKHSGAEAAHIDIREREGWILVRVADSGNGAELDQVYARRGIEPGFGLFSIEERLESLGGRMTIETVPGDGWVTTLSVPKRKAAEEEGPELQESGEVVFRSGTATAPAEIASVEEEKYTIRILVADDHLVMREGLASLLDEQKGIKVVGQAETGREALALVRELQPDLVLIDVTMPDMDGIEATAKIVTTHPNVAVLGLSMHDDPATRQGLLDAGALEFLSKTDPPRTIVTSIRHCAKRVGHAENKN